MSKNKGRTLSSSNKLPSTVGVFSALARSLWRAGALNFGNTAEGHDLASTIAVKIHGRGGHLRGWEIAVRHIFSQRIFGLGDSDRAEFHNCRRVSERTGIAVDGGFRIWFEKNASAKRMCIIRPPEQTDF